MFDVATQVKEKSGGKVTALPGISVLFQNILCTQNVSDYIDGNKIDLTSRYTKALDIATKFIRQVFLENRKLTHRLTIPVLQREK